MTILKGSFSDDLQRKAASMQRIFLFLVGILSLVSLSAGELGQRATITLRDGKVMTDWSVVKWDLQNLSVSLDGGKGQTSTPSDSVLSVEYNMGNILAYEQGRVLLEKGKFEDAAKAFDSVGTSAMAHAGRIQALIMAGEAWEKAGKWEQSAASYKKLVTTYGEWVYALDARVRLGRALARSGKIEEAEKVLCDLEAEAPRIPSKRWKTLTLNKVLYGLSEVARAKTPKDPTAAAAKLLEALDSQASSEDPDTWGAGAIQLLADYQTLKEAAKAKALAQRICYQPIDENLRAKAFLFLAKSVDVTAKPLEVLDLALVAMTLAAPNDQVHKDARALASIARTNCVKDTSIPSAVKEDLPILEGR
jgi:tetratricopeptide (TPR) repeat protein